jgi:tetratricopeptide (TPR) repeat protein
VHALLALAFALALRSVPVQDPGADLWAVGRRLEALEAWQAALTEAPQDAALRRRLVEAQLAVHRYAAALETAQALGPEDDRLRGLALYRLGRWEEALAHLEGGEPLGVLMRIEAFEALGRSAEADAEIERAAQLLGPDDVRVLAHRARALARRGDDAAALELYARAHALDPWDSAALFGLGRALVAVGRREEGLAKLEQHRELTPKLDALDFAQRSVDLGPLHAANHAAVGDAERALGRFEAARAAYGRGLDLAQPAEITPIALRCARLLAEDLGELDGAVALLEGAGTKSDDARCWVRAGDLLQEAGRPVDALQRYLKARELRPDDKAIEARIEATHASYRKEPRK